MTSMQNQTAIPGALYMPINPFCALSGIGRTTLYARLGSGEIRAVKVGRRTLVDVGQALEWLASRPQIQIGKAA